MTSSNKKSIYGLTLLVVILAGISILIVTTHDRGTQEETIQPEQAFDEETPGSPLEEYVGKSVASTPILEDALSEFWEPIGRELSERKGEELESWFEEWSSRQRGKEVEWNVLSRGEMPLKDDTGTTTGMVLLVFRPMNPQLQNVIKVNCPAPSDGPGVRDLYYNARIELKGIIDRVTNQIPTPGMDSLPFGSLITVTLRDVTLAPIPE